ncbi:c(7)-type cytochrome triheme domain-containing protein [Ferrimonas sediminicola]|nr:c(7)-type cytochrome triheme domain-containing protein [Ferrimonas sediminicola]
MSNRVTVSAVLLGTCLFAAGLVQAKDKRVWSPLETDGIHDPDAPGLELLQWPDEALRAMLPDHPGIGNQVDWLRATSAGQLRPVDALYEVTRVRQRDKDIVMGRTGEMAMVRFPHGSHSREMDCDNCHDQFFVAKAGANHANMFSILAGENCGRCHGAVAFPLTECRRCHTDERGGGTVPGVQAGQGRQYDPVVTR